jgi:hypothetical protein
MENPLDTPKVPESTEPIVDKGYTIKTEQDAVTAPLEQVKTPPTMPVDGGTPVVDYRKRYEDLRKEFDRRNNERSEMLSRLDAIEKGNMKQAELLARATEEPYDPRVFKEAWERDGVKAFDPYYNKREQKLVERYDKAIAELSQQSVQDRTRLEILVRRNDDESYPNFQELEPIMQEIAASPNCPVDLNRPVPEVLDVLYKLARESNSTEAVKMAEKFGAEKKEKELAKEASTAVATGGKVSGTPSTAELKNMKLEDLERVVMQLHGMADRD